MKANFAKWEPRHGKFRYRHPWAQYLEIGGIARDCAYRIHALNAYLNYETQVINYIYQTNKEPRMSLIDFELLTPLVGLLGGGFLSYSVIFARYLY